jgi:UDP-N-acetylglucosamine--N-acetylmuramyl-(pentapeptide) pyrophosphoryl-undecaprenol N-acetylglucosamine transferase
VLAAADLGVSRAGGTVWELAAAGLPALLIPYPHATGDHQRANAEHFAGAGGAVIVDDAALDGELLKTRVAELRGTPGRLADMRSGMLRCARPDAAAAVARELLRLAGGRT